MNLHTKHSKNPDSGLSAPNNNLLAKKIRSFTIKGDFASLLDPLVEDKQAWAVILRCITSPKEKPQFAAQGLGMSVEQYQSAQKRACSVLFKKE